MEDLSGPFLGSSILFSRSFTDGKEVTGTSHAARDCFQRPSDKQRHQWPRRHEGTKKNRVVFFVASSLRGPSTLLIIPVPLKPVYRPPRVGANARQLNA
jgi:hypothetical protein